MEELSPQQFEFLKKIKEKDSRPYIYVIRCKNFYKVGYCSNLNSRLNGLQCGNPFTLEVIYAARFSAAHALEKELHILFTKNNKRHIREWFYLDKKDLNFIDIVVKKVEEELEKFKKSGKKVWKPSL